MFSDRQARAAWRLFRARAGWMLGSVSADVRKELLADLEAHVRDGLAETAGVDEHDRLAKVLDQLGDPRKFLAPLVAEAVLKRPRPVSKLFLPAQTVLVAAHRGLRHMAVAASLLVALVAGAALAMAGLMRLIRPAGAGVFRLDADTVQIRLLGLQGGDGVQLLPVWLAALLALAGLGIVLWSVNRSRRQLVRILARS